MRLRDYDIKIGTLPTGKLNAITDVSGVLVGHATLQNGAGALIPGQGPVRTGVTAILPHGGNLYAEKVAAAIFTFNGYGKAVGFEQIRELGVLETPVLLTNTLNVGRAADALVTYMLQQNPEIGITTGSLNPVVGECNDGFLNDIQGRHVQESHVMQALAAATNGPVQEGCVGAGTGTGCFGFKGGIGTASRLVGSFTVGALVQSNFGSRPHLMMGGVPVGQRLKDRLLPAHKPGPGSIMMVLATNAPLSARQLGRVAKRAVFGLARTGSAASSGSGDFVVAFSTTNLRRHDASDLDSDGLRHVRLVSDEDHKLINGLFLAAIETVEEAILNSLVAAETTVGRDDHTLYALPMDEVRAWF